MPPVVYFWNSNNTEWGHISLKLSDGTYISHWPAETKNMANVYPVPGRQMRNLAYDVFAEKRDPDEIIELCDDMLNESKVKDYWNECKSTTATTYHSVTNNCARVVLKCIEIGFEGQQKSAYAWDKAEEEFQKRINMIGASSCTDMADTTIALGHSNFVQVTPPDILELVKYWKKAFLCEDSNEANDDRFCAIV